MPMQIAILVYPQMGARATTHWYKLGELRDYGARPSRRRVVRDGRIVTAAGVSAGIDMGLVLAQQLAGSLVAKVIQLASGSLRRAGWLTQLITSLAMRRYDRLRPARQ
jgi:transcriptional regulator GlxA family with amidase domain